MAILISPLAYLASFGPACWIAARLDPQSALFDTLYSPIGHLLECPGAVSDTLRWYAGMGLPAGSYVAVPVENGPKPCRMYIQRSSGLPPASVFIIGAIGFAVTIQIGAWWINRPDDKLPVNPPAPNPGTTSEAK